MNSQQKLAGWIYGLALVALTGLSLTASGRDGGGEESTAGSRIWHSSTGVVLAEGRLVAQASGLVRIETLAGGQILIKTNQLSWADQCWLNGEPAVRPRADVAETYPEQTRSRDDVAAAFQTFEKLGKLKTHAEDGYLLVESNGLPSHQMMVGIKTWQQQVPLPQKYVGINAWRIPLRPKPADKPASTKGRFLRGAIAIGVNGIPIFNPLNNRGADSYAIGELDQFGGHCGRADDYHYHIAPVHLEETVGPGKPIAYALDGYPIYGYTEPDGSPVKDLDECHGHQDAAGNYHYHAAKKYPYFIGAFRGEVIEKEGQVDPQPRAEPMRPDTRPLPGAEVIGYEQKGENRFELTYQQKGKRGTVAYQLNGDDSVTFEFNTPDGQQTTETYRGRPRRGGPGSPGELGGPRQPGRRAEGRGGPSGPAQLSGGQAGQPRGGNRDPGDEPRASSENSSPLEPPPEAATKRGRAGNRPGGRSANSAQSPRKSNVAAIQVGSASVDDRGFLNIDCTCDGKRQSPEVHWGDVPVGTKALVVSIWHTAPDQEKSYWLVYNIPADTRKLELNAGPIGEVGLNDKRQAGYDPPCSQGPGVKTYHVSVIALSRKLDLPAQSANRAKMLEAIADCTLAEGTLDCKVERRVQQ